MFSHAMLAALTCNHMHEELESLTLFLAVLQRDIPSLVSLAQSHRTLAEFQSVAASQSVRQSDSQRSAHEYQRVKNTLKKNRIETRNELKKREVIRRNELGRAVAATSEEREKNERRRMTQ